MEQRRKRYLHAADVRNANDLSTAVNNTFEGLTVIPDNELIEHLRALDNPRIEAIYNATNSTTYRIVYGPIDADKRQVEYWQLFFPNLNVARRTAPTIDQLSKFPKVDDELLETFEFERIVYGHKDVKGRSIAIE